MNARKSALTVAIGSAFAVSLSAIPAAQAGNNPFSMEKLQNGYLVADNHAGKAKDGKCGEGKCGGKKADDKSKARDGKCGEGKCGGRKADDKSKARDGKCGEGKCGGRK